MKTIGLLVYDDMQALDIAGPLDVFGVANGYAGGAQPYRLCIIGIERRTVRAENGLALVPEYGLGDAPKLDTLLIPGGAGSRVVDREERLLAWLCERARTTRRVVSVCTGLYVLAATGLIDNRRVTTHWRFADDIARRYPTLRVDSDCLYLRDGRFATSGGLTAGMDLALALVEEDLGKPAALAVARELVMYVKRPGNQTQFSAPLAAQSQCDDRMSRLLDWLLEHLREEITTERMAEHLAMSARNFRRVFVATFNATPGRFIERLRLDRACLRLTEGNSSIERIANQIGFHSADAFRRAFRVRYGVAPNEYRARFAG